MNHICIDLELEQSFNNPQTPDSQLPMSKIIQAGWVVFETQGEGIYIHKRQCHHVNIGVPLSKFIKDLTKIKDSDIKSGINLLEIYQILVEDQKEFQTSRIVRQWGSGDMEHLKMELESETSMKELNASNFKWEFGHSGFNVKHLYQAYALANDLNTSGGLSKSLTKCGLKWVGSGKHNALNDALNTARFYAYLENKLRVI